MSCSKPIYQPEKCDGQPCPGDCDASGCPLAKYWLEDEEEEEKKKGTPEGAPSQHNYGTTPGVKNQILAQIWFEQIGDKPLRRPKDPNVDRMFRRLIQEANNNGDCIINNGEGYYRPGKDDNVELAEYLLKEQARAREIINKCIAMRQAYNRRCHSDNI